MGWRSNVSHPCISRLISPNPNRSGDIFQGSLKNYGTSSDQSMGDTCRSENASDECFRICGIAGRPKLEKHFSLKPLILPAFHSPPRWLASTDDLPNAAGTGNLVWNASHWNEGRPCSSMSNDESVQRSCPARTTRTCLPVE